MSGKRNRRSSSLSDLVKKFKFTEDIPDASSLLAESPPTASTLRARSPSIELASENQHLECRCSVSVERAASLISATKSLASRLEDLTYSFERLPVEPFSVAFFSAFSGKQTARIESIRDLSIAELNALSLGDLLATVFKLKHNLVMERAKIMEADVVAYLQGLGLLEHMHVFQSWVSRWYCPRTSHMPSVLLVLGGSPFSLFYGSPTPTIGVTSARPRLSRPLLAGSGLSRGSSRPIWSMTARASCAWTRNMALAWVPYCIGCDVLLSRLTSVALPLLGLGRA